ncbi:hypothetical protein MYCTH_2300347 [Thermothelomyces thermophilus ATCC 42464]|uniref:Uncharacterized protein n=1 Tax=Thermothelomyces thermophilus (strain ATCC 42464 / BCRC 31852 / DSM 1799) TaxID=573729 RepID=G2QB38_THET4|nr:uncharacterized protein MYCTH_2300347 [Thermothelomyces thermophilus ATCC 42464]AEO55976.1 hypothetical protein MYCTH_2300347 [Thermothelomyces thermophilus ATCC 42464]
MLWDKFMWYAGSDGSDRHYDSEKRLCFGLVSANSNPHDRDRPSKWGCGYLHYSHSGASAATQFLRRDGPVIVYISNPNRPPAHLVPGPVSQAVWQAYDSQPFSQTVEVTVATWTSTDVTVTGCVTVV